MSCYDPISFIEFDPAMIEEAVRARVFTPKFRKPVRFVNMRDAAS